MCVGIYMDGVFQKKKKMLPVISSILVVGLEREKDNKIMYNITQGTKDYESKICRMQD